MLRGVSFIHRIHLLTQEDLEMKDQNTIYHQQIRPRLEEIAHCAFSGASDSDIREQGRQAECDFNITNAYGSAKHIYDELYSQ